MIKFLFASVCVFVLAACQQATPTAAGPAIRLYAMDCGRLHLSNAANFSDDHAYDGVATELIVPGYLIRHPKGDLIWECGLSDSIADAENGIQRGNMHLTLATKLEAQLAQLNLTPADIEFVSFSHSHFDHLGNASLFPNARWIVDADERAYMFREEARASQHFPLYAVLENAPTTLIEGDADYDIFGDGSVIIVQTPGHTPGHTILRVNLPNSGTVLLTGDMWHLAESRVKRRVPIFNTDRAQTLASMDRIEALATATNARVVREHVIEDFRAMPAFPAAMD